MYADYEFYVANYDSIPRGRVTLFLKKASALMGSFLNQAPPQPYSERVKLCCCDIADMLYRAEQTGEIQSENADGYCVTYRDTTTSTVSQRACDTMMNYLGDSNLMYRGAVAYE